jgi:thiol:disulfide interchange protein DsbA
VIRDFARFYAKGGGVTENDFARRAAAPEMDAIVQRTDALIRGWQVPSTPSLVVAGRYRLNLDEVSTSADLAALTNFLIGLERSRLKKAAPAP